MQSGQLKRREVITLLGAAAASWPLVARAQQPARIREIAIWMGRPNDSEGQRHAAAFREELEKFGWTVGRNIRADFHWVSGDMDRARMAREIVEQQPDVIVAETTVGAEALAHESRAIPIIFVNVSDPVGSGFVTNLAHPDGNITGFMSNEPTLGGKWPELLKEIAPTVARIGFMFNPDTAPYAEAFLRQAEGAARSLGLEVAAARIHNDADIEQATADLAGSANGGLIILPESTTNARFELIITAAARYRVPAIYAHRYECIAGGLICYGVDIADLFRGAAVYIDRIFRGEKLTDLPVQAPARFRLVVNLKAAKALDLTLPTATLLRADEVIE
jgi:putative tryptophan/tyrosine transport system substrate-binding protein